MASKLLRFLTFFIATSKICESKWIWNTVMIGGGGEIEGLHFAENGNLYARTDVGGVYIYQWENQYWFNLFDWLPYSQKKWFSIDSFTSSPHEPNTLYAACGNGIGSDVLKSTNNGTTWTPTNFANGSLYGGGNQNDRWGGYRLIVHPDPTQKKTIYFGSRQQGLWRNDVGGGNDEWYKVDSFPNIEWNETNAVGISYVNINPFSYNIYASVVNFGIYQSKDDGKTWKKITNTEFNITQSLRSTFNPKLNDGMFYVANDGGGFYVFNEDTDEWSDISPNDDNKSGKDIDSHGLDITPGILSSYSRGNPI